MKTSQSARKVWKLRITLTCLAIAAVASFDFWAGSYCYRHRNKAPLQQTSAHHFQNGNVTVSEMWLAAR